MNDKLEAAQHKFVESIGKLCDSFGLNKFIAQLYALLYLSDRPLSLDDLVEKLKVSKGNISLNIRELENWGAVKNIWVKGSRKDYYEANLDLKKVIANKLKAGIQKRMGQVQEMLEEFKKIIQSAGDDLTDEEKHITQVYEDRLKKVEELKSLTLNTLSIAEKFLS